MATQVSDEEIITTLKTVTDPELGVNIIDLGLVYRVDIDDSGDIQLFMTLTSPGCPAGPEIKNDVKEALTSLDGVSNVNIQFVFNPPWTPAMMTNEAKDELGMDYDEEDYD
ncbi:MAG: system Fe-S cluster assembly protein [Chloroflexi bacterium]|jgi:metal-sulfur cluster biosynthetic enzyme|nr:system Fe-S cluster assembly protein [Chloroflexota bacterium]